MSVRNGTHLPPVSRRRPAGPERGYAVDDPQRRQYALAQPELGRHQWVALAYHRITDTQASAASHGAYVHVRPATMLGLFVGCGLCDGAYADVVGRPCPGRVVEAAEPAEGMAPVAPAPTHG